MTLKARVLRGLRDSVRDIAGDLLFALRITPVRLARRGRLTVATFHRVLPPELRESYPFPGLVVTPDEFSWYLALFAKYYTCDTLAGAARRWLRGETLERPLLAITFDDGQEDNFRHALPALERAGLHATFFVPVESVERNQSIWHDRLGLAAQRLAVGDPQGALTVFAELGIRGSPPESPSRLAREVVLRAKQLSPGERREWVERIQRMAGGPAGPSWGGAMTWEQLGTLVRRGHEIGSHSMTHALLPQCDDEELEREVDGSRRALESRLGVPIVSFCYPNGDCDRRIAEVVRRAGYDQAVTAEWGTNPRGTSLFELRRVDMVAEHVMRRDGVAAESLLAWRISGLFPGWR